MRFRNRDCAASSTVTSGSFRVPLSYHGVSFRYLVLLYLNPIPAYVSSVADRIRSGCLWSLPKQELHISAVSLLTSFGSTVLYFPTTAAHGEAGWFFVFVFFAFAFVFEQEQAFPVEI